MTMSMDVVEDFAVTTFAVDQRDATGTRRMAAVGRLTGLGGELLEGAVAGLFGGVPAHRPRRVWVNLSAVTGAEPAGIAGVVRARRIAWRHGAELAVFTG